MDISVCLFVDITGQLLMVASSGWYGIAGLLPLMRECPGLESSP